MDARTARAWLLSCGVVGLCGLAGLAIDAFDILKLLVDGPRWLNQLDLLVAIAATAAVGGLDAYYRRYR